MLIKGVDSVQRVLATGKTGLCSEARGMIFTGAEFGPGFMFKLDW
jgi:hypothetical protein